MSYIKLENISFGYDKSLLLEDFSLDINEGDIHCIVGPSGCGKSSLLHLVAGFLTPKKGGITLNESVLFDKTKGVSVVPEKRSVGVVFQEHCLFSHLSVEDNLKFGLKGNDSYIEELLNLVGLQDKKKSFPEELSGGEKQRVAIARTLASRPKVLLMDEPFSSLDQDLRVSLRRELKKIVKALNLTTIMVTHSREEAYELADSITFINSKDCFQTGNYNALLNNPQSLEVASFLGSGIFLKGKYDFEKNVIDTVIGKLTVDTSYLGTSSNRALLFIPNSNIEISDEPNISSKVVEIVSSLNGDLLILESDEVYGKSFSFQTDPISKENFESAIKLLTPNKAIVFSS